MIESHDDPKTKTPDEDPDLGGYAGRDPKTELPRIPSEPDTQDDPRSHDAAPDSGDEPESPAPSGTHPDTSE